MSQLQNKQTQRLVLSWIPGSGGDMVRSCLFALLEPGTWECKPSTYSADNSPIPSLFWNNNLISFIEKRRGGVSTPDVWNDMDKPSILTSMHKTHYEDDDYYITGKVATVLQDSRLNPVVTFICMKDSKYALLSKKNFMLKRSKPDAQFDYWIDKLDKTIKFREEHPDKVNQVFHDINAGKTFLDVKVHMMYMDNFFKWKTFKKELEDYLKCYNIDGYKDNFSIVKQFWQCWINEQVYQ